MPLLPNNQLKSRNKQDENLWQRRVRLIRAEFSARVQRLRESGILDIIQLTPTEELARYLVPEIREQEIQRLMKEGGTTAVNSYEQRMRRMLANRLEKQVDEVSAKEDKDNA